MEVNTEQLCLTLGQLVGCAPSLTFWRVCFAMAEETSIAPCPEHMLGGCLTPIRPCLWPQFANLSPLGQQTAFPES